MARFFIMDDVDGTIETAHRGSFCPPSNCRGGQEHSSIPLSRMERAALIDRAFRLEYATIVWMMIEGAVAIWSGAWAHSVSLVAFGIDSLIEIASAVVLIWRLTTELRWGERLAEQAEPSWPASRCASFRSHHLCGHCGCIQAGHAQRRGILFARAGGDTARDAHHVSSSTPKDRPSGSSRQPCNAGRCCREHNLQLPLFHRCGRIGG